MAPDQRISQMNQALDRRSHYALQPWHISGYNLYANIQLFSLRPLWVSVNVSKDSLYIFHRGEYADLHAFNTISFSILTMLAMFLSADSSLLQYVVFPSIINNFLPELLQTHSNKVVFLFWKVAPWSFNPVMTKNTESVCQIKLPCCSVRYDTIRITSGVSLLQILSWKRKCLMRATSGEGVWGVVFTSIAH